MKEFVEKLIGRLEECLKQEKRNLYSYIEEGFGYSQCSDAFNDGETLGAFNAYSDMLDFIKELAEEYEGEELRKLQKVYNFITREINPYGKPFEGTVYEFGLKVMKYIRNLSTEEYNNGWIACSEKLPVYLDNVLVFTENGGRTIAHIKHTPIEWVDMYCNKIENVIAWMPLPEPYQKGDVE